MTKSSDLAVLAGRVEQATGADNALDVLIEVALFKPDQRRVSARANFAGTKVIYTAADGHEETCWAPDWTCERVKAAVALRAHVHLTENSNG